MPSNTRELLLKYEREKEAHEKRRVAEWEKEKVEFDEMSKRQMELSQEVDTHQQQQQQHQTSTQQFQQDQMSHLQAMRAQHQLALQEQAQLHHQQLENDLKAAYAEVNTEKPPSFEQNEARATKYAEDTEREFWESGKQTWRKLAERRPLSHAELEAEMARQALSHGHSYSYGHCNSPTVDDSSLRYPPRAHQHDQLTKDLPKFGTASLSGLEEKAKPSRSPPRPDQDPVWSALVRMEQKSRESIESLGFLWRTVTMGSGESVGFWEKAAKLDNGSTERPTLLILHGLGMDCGEMLSNFASTPALKLQIPDGARVLVPDGFGHGSRVQWSKYAAEASWGATHAGQAQDLEEFLRHVGVNQQERLDLLGFGMGAAQLLALSTRVWSLNGVTREYAQRFNRVVLLNPTLAHSTQARRLVQPGDIAADSDDDTYHRPVPASDSSATAAVDYHTKGETRHWLELNGYNQRTCRSLGPILLMQRQQQEAPARYWTQVAAKSVCAMNNANMAGVEALAKAEVPVLVVYGSLNRVVEPQVRDAIYERLDTAKLGIEHILEGYGQVGCPADPNKFFLDAAYEAAAEFLGYHWKEHPVDRLNAWREKQARLQQQKIGQM